MHRDIKCENIFISRNTDNIYKYPHYLVIGDYGISKVTSSMTNTINTGTEYTKAPEVSKGNYGLKVHFI